jgi:four helix bundle protein
VSRRTGEQDEGASPIARGSTQECVPLLEVSRRRGFVEQTRHDELHRDLEEIAKIISGLIHGLDKREL